MEVGLYGKLFSHGDFLRRRASDAFVERWDAWLQQCMAASRAALGERWLNLYLTSPAWRFACAPGVCGPSAVLGVMVPSVDRVGRYFPLTLFAEAPRPLGVLVAATEGRAFFEQAELVAVEAMAEDEVDFDSFDARVARLAETLAFIEGPQHVTLDRSAAALLGEKSEIGWQMPLAAVNRFTSVWAQLVSHRLDDLYDPVSMWWTDGSTDVEPSCLISTGLPHPDSYAAFLHGGWSPERWRMVQAVVDTPELLQESAPIPVPITCRSAAATDVGGVRHVNQDSLLERSEIGLWVVADGMGGHADGDVASRMVCDSLIDFSPAPSFDETIEAVRARLQEVNDHLLRTSARSLRGAKTGSTVVVLLIRGGECAALWAGDSRVYRLRDKRLEQLTRDHSAIMSDPDAQANVITRAVGVSPALLLDVHRDWVLAGDRFLLCSDGLTRQIPDAQIEAWMQHEDIDISVEGLIQTTLDAGAPDNVTVLIVEALDPAAA